MPNNERATAYYKRAMEAVLRKSNHPEEIVMKTEADLRTGKMVIVCRPAHLPRVAAIRFEGNAAIGRGALESAMAKVAIGQDYSERDFRRTLELNVRPLYEELGRLTVAFPRVSMAGAGDGAVVVTAAIDEGPLWRLGTVRLIGDDLPLADMHDAARFAARIAGELEAVHGLRREDGTGAAERRLYHRGFKAGAGVSRLQRT